MAIAIVAFATTALTRVHAQALSPVAVLDSGTKDIHATVSFTVYDITRWKKSDSLKKVSFTIEITTTNSDPRYYNAYAGYIPDKIIFLNSEYTKRNTSIKNDCTDCGTTGLECVVNGNHRHQKLTVMFYCQYDRKIKDYRFKMSKTFWIDLSKYTDDTNQAQQMLAVKNK